MFRESHAQAEDQPSSQHRTSQHPLQMILTTIVTVIHCYYGYVAEGGPEGVGHATGRAIRASIIALVVCDIVLSLALWGPTQQAQISG